MNLTCRQLRELLYEHHAGELAIEHRVSFHAHLESCQDCTFYAESYTHTVRIAKKLPQPSLPTETETRLRAALKEHL